jgi:hypothetical protein
MGLIPSIVKDGPPSHARTSRVYGDGPFRCLQGASRRKWLLPTTGGNPEKCPRGGLYVPRLLGGGGGLGARPEGMP